jgi:hypothetical protein
MNGVSLFAGVRIQFARRRKLGPALTICYNKGFVNLLNAEVNYSVNGRSYATTLGSRGTTIGVNFSYPIRLHGPREIIEPVRYKSRLQARQDTTSNFIYTKASFKKGNRQIKAQGFFLPGVTVTGAVGEIAYGYFTKTGVELGAQATAFTINYQSGSQFTTGILGPFARKYYGLKSSAVFAEVGLAAGIHVEGTDDQPRQRSVDLYTPLALGATFKATPTTRLDLSIKILTRLSSGPSITNLAPMVGLSRQF